MSESDIKRLKERVYRIRERKAVRDDRERWLGWFFALVIVAAVKRWAKEIAETLVTLWSRL